MNNLFPVGKIIGFHGLKGEVKISLSTNNPKLLSQINNVEINLTDGKQISADISSLRIEKNIIVMSFDDYPSRTDVEQFLNAEVFVTRDQLTSLEAGEWWIKDLVGIDVFTTDGLLVGKVADIIDAGNQLLEIQVADSDKTIMVPFVEALVPVVDPINRRIEVADIPGLLELQ